MKTFIFKYLLIIAAVTGAMSVRPAQAQDLPNISTPHWLEPYRTHLGSILGVEYSKNAIFKQLD